MRKELLLRTDVLPEELPVLFSNKSVYNNFTYKDIESLRELDKVDPSIFSKTFTIPLYFNIPNGIYKTRKIGLLHPIGQLQIAEYLLKYESQILAHCSKSNYSVRSPVKRNLPTLDLKKSFQKKLKRVNEDFLIKDTSTISSDENSIFYLSYFTYNYYKRIDELFTSARFNRTKYKYKYFLKLDIQRCFPSIYTHSLSWAIMGSKSLGKKYSGDKYNSTFANSTDRVAQRLNFNETNGLVVGPEFSRILAEILLTYIDTKVDKRLYDKNIELNSDYKIYRYVDDFFIFAHDEQTIELIQSTVTTELEKVNLTVNLNKSELQQKPFKFFDSSIIKLKRVIKDFENDRLIRKQNKFSKKVNEYLIQEHSLKKTWRDSDITNVIFDNNSDWNNMFERLEEIIKYYPDSRGRIINYFLKAIRNSIKFNHEFNSKESRLIRTKLEIISNIYSLYIDNKSTTNFISIHLQLIHQIDFFLKREKQDLSKVEQDNAIKKIDLIFESLFENTFRLIKNNFNSLQDMGDLIIYMKLLRKQLSPQFLVSILQKYKHSYFIYCSVAYYILDENLKGVKANYKTVYTVLNKEVNFLVENFEDKGVSSNLLDAEYFYFINDFSKYPGFGKKTRKCLSKKFEKQFKVFSHKGNSEIQKVKFDLWKKITEYPYFDWEIKLKDFERKVIKKSINRRNLSNSIHIEY